MFFYLGLCESCRKKIITDYKINNKKIWMKKGNVGGDYAYCISKRGITHFLNFYPHNNSKYLDVILEKISIHYPANIIRAELMSPFTKSQAGIFYIDKNNYKNL